MLSCEVDKVTASRENIQEPILVLQLDLGLRYTPYKGL